MAGKPLTITLTLPGRKLLTTQPPPGPAAIPAAGSASVVGTPVTGSSAASPLTLVVPSVVAGHALFVLVANGSGSTNAFTVTDDKGNAWGTKVTDGWVSGGSFTRVELWAAFNVAGGTTTITCTSAGTNLQGIAMEVVNVSALDVASTAGSGVAAGTTSDDQTPDILSTTADSFYIAAINGSNSGSVTFSHGNVGNIWTALAAPTNVSSTNLRGAYAAVTGVGRRHDGWARSNGTAATGTLTVAFKAAVAVDNRNAILAITGGGVTVQFDTKGGQVVTPVTGGGDVVSAATKAAYLASGITGGGVVVAVDRKAGAGATNITGGGDILPTDRKGGQSAPSLTGGGDILNTGKKGALVGTGPTGGGDILTTGRKVGGASVTITGGGDVTLSGQKGALISVGLTGGGVVTISYVVDRGGRTVVTQLTGGGDITIPFTSSRLVNISITGGGVVTISTPQSNASLVVAFDMMEEGSGTGSSARKPRGRTEFDDWTLTDDDVAVLEMYAMRVR